MTIPTMLDPSPFTLRWILSGKLWPSKPIILSNDTCEGEQDERDTALTPNENPNEILNKLVRSEVPPPPVAQLIGNTLTSIEPGKATMEFQATERHANPMGTLHGGVLCDVADLTRGTAYATCQAIAKFYSLN